MPKNKIGNVIIIKEPESNIIEEAVVYLKENINIENIAEKSDKKELKIDIIKESEEIVNNKSRENNDKFNNFQKRKLVKKIKFLKAIIFVLIILLIYFIKK